jgi:hypothetical protein
LLNLKGGIGPGTYTGAGDGIRTRDINLGKVALYQLSYSRVWAYTTFSDDFVAKSIHLIATRALRGSVSISVAFKVPDKFVFQMAKYWVLSNLDGTHI